MMASLVLFVCVLANELEGKHGGVVTLSVLSAGFGGWVTDNRAICTSRVYLMPQTACDHWCVRSTLMSGVKILAVPTLSDHI